MVQDFRTAQNSLAERMILFGVLVLYILVASYTMLHHEMWGDELHSWNLAKSSNSLKELIDNRRYEGHPPVWHLILWGISSCTHNPHWMQGVHLAIAIATVVLILFYAPLPLWTKVLLPFGYYFLYEYAVLSRNYAIGILAGFLICILLQKEHKYKLWGYYALLLLMSNTHLLAMLLAGCLHLYFLMTLAEQKKGLGVIALHVLLGILIFLPAIGFIMPPSDTDLSIAASMKRWSYDRLLIAAQAPLRAFVPMPAWWKYHFWNWECIIELNAQYKVMKVVSLLLSLGFIWLGVYLLKGSRKSQVLFVANIAFTWIAGLIYPIGTQRYVGFIFIGFIVAYWLYAYKRPLSPAKRKIVNLLLGLQCVAGIFITVKDIRLPFSNFDKVKELVAEVPPGKKVVTEYWALIAGSAYLDQPFYCVDLQQEESFIQWGSNMAVMTRKATRYYDGVKALFEKERLNEIYLYSASAPEILRQTDAKLFAAYKVQLVSKREGAIEKWSNLYLYRISVL